MPEISTIPAALGAGLPEKEEQLFELQAFPILDIDGSITNLGNVGILKDLLTMMIEDALPMDERNIEQAFAQGDWVAVEKLAHKMKSGAVYCGATRMKFACQYLERYQKAEQTQLLDQLYQQLIQVIAETKKAIIAWLQTV